MLLICSVIKYNFWNLKCRDVNCVCVYLKAERAVWEPKEPALLSERKRKNRLP